MNSVAAKLVKLLRSSPAARSVMGVQGSPSSCFSTGRFDNDDDEPASNNEALEIDDSDFLPQKPDLELQGVDPGKGWNFRGFTSSSVYIEGDIETRVYNDSLSGEVKSIPEICVRRDGKIRLIKGGESVSSISIDELREGLL
ncbi:unnamed protein product [Withania somnifera]